MTKSGWIELLAGIDEFQPIVVVSTPDYRGGRQAECTLLWNVLNEEGEIHLAPFEELLLVCDCKQDILDARNMVFVNEYDRGSGHLEYEEVSLEDVILPTLYRM